MDVAREPRRSTTWWLLALLVGSWGLRALLAFRGGQMFWLDEANRWYPGMRIAAALHHHHDAHEAITELLKQSAQHPGFLLFTVPAAELYEALGSTPTALSIVAALLGLASVAVIALVYALARRAGSERGEALLAAALTASTAFLVVYARHVLPYDASLALALAALWLGLAPATSWARSLVVGFVTALALLTYYGNQSLVLAIVLVHVLAGTPRHVRLLGALVGGAFPLVQLQLVSIAAGGPTFFERFWFHQVGNGPRTMVDVQGDLAEGWLLPIRYLWASEHGLAVLWLVALLAAPFLIRRASGVGWWLTIVVLLYVQLALWSTGLQVAAALGRLVRPFTPFLCLLAATMVWRLPRRGLAALVVLLVAVQAAWNLQVPLGQTWPSQLHKAIGPSRSLISVRGPEEAGKTICDLDNTPKPGMVLVNTCTWLYPLREVQPAIVGRTLQAWPHPLQYLPYQYEVLNPTMRAIAARADLRMRLVDQSDGAN